MPVVIRVRPQYGAGAMGYGGIGGMGGFGYGGNVFQHQLRNERQKNNLRLQYERALWAQKMQNVQLQTAMQLSSNPYGASPYGAYGARPLGAVGYPAMGAYGVQPMAAHGLFSNGLFGSTGLFGGLGIGGGLGGFGSLGMGLF